MDILSLLLFIVFIVIPLVNSVIQRFRGGSQQKQGRPQQGRSQQGQTQSPSSPSGRKVEQDDELTRRIEEARQRVRRAMNDDEAPRRRTTRQQEAGLSSPFEAKDEDSSTTLFRNERETSTMQWGSSSQAQTAQGQTAQGRAAQGRAAQGRAAQGQAAQGQTAQGRTSSPRAFLPREGSSAQPAYTQDQSRRSGTSAQQRPQQRSQQQASLPRESETAVGSFSSLQSERKELERAPAMQVTRLRGDQTSTLLKDGELLTFDRNSILRGYIWHEILSEPRGKKRSKLSRR